MKGWLDRNWKYLMAPAVALCVASICWFVDTGLFLVMPGDSVDTTSMVKVPSSASKKGTGRLFVVTVYSSPANVDEWLFGHVWPHARLVPANTQLPPNTTFERFQHLEEAMMQDSQTTAKVVAMRQAGYQVTEHGQGAVIDAVQKGSAAERAGLQKGDLITAVDGQKVDIAQGLVDVLASRRPGTTVTLTIKPNNSDSDKQLTAVLGARPDDPARSLLGVTPLTDRPTYEFPVQVNIDSRGIIGPSAGLVLTLSILQALSPADITRGHDIAATGTIDLSGTVGPIGDVEDKVLAAQGHAEYFLVPKDDYAAAKGAASSINVVEIDTIQQASQFLEQLASRK